MESENEIRYQIENFILYWTSSDEERERMKQALNVFMEDVYEV